jgi:hypothetical protein
MRDATGDDDGGYIEDDRERQLGEANEQDFGASSPPVSRAITTIT